jgi:hypothetical protein
MRTLRATKLCLELGAWSAFPRPLVLRHPALGSLGLHASKTVPETRLVSAQSCATAKRAYTAYSVDGQRFPAMPADATVEVSRIGAVLEHLSRVPWVVFHGPEFGPFT